MRRFNVTGVCVPEKHYMVDISGKIEQIKKMVDYGDYFTINRARQYGKTTTLSQLKRVLIKDYIVASISFEGVGDAFESSATFCSMFKRRIRKAIRNQYDLTGVSEPEVEYQAGNDITHFELLDDFITEICKNAENAPTGKKIVLLIDEVDRTSNNRVYLHFLGLLRDKYLSREQGEDYTFHSVILAGVYDIRNIKLKMINEGVYTPTETEGKLLNSPWNIAVNFDVDMSFSPVDIASMLRLYESEHNTGMDITKISEELYSYTNGYPFLVSRICQCIDEELNRDWTVGRVQIAINKILRESNTLFDDISKNLESNKELYDLIYDVLILGNRRIFNINNQTIKIAQMYGIIKDSERGVVVSNRIFELVICDYLIAKDEEIKRTRDSGVFLHDVMNNGHFDIELCLRKFAQHYAEIYNEIDENFIEREGRLLFLSYLRPLINGQGFYHIESQFTDLRRMDIVVDWGRDQFIIELKLWKGDAKHEDAYEQLAGYLESKNVTTGYMLTFDFRKNANKQPRAEWVEYNGKKIFDVIV